MSCAPWQPTAMLAVAVFLLGSLPSTVHAQSGTLGLSAGLDVLYDYPRDLRPACDRGFGIGPSLRVSRPFKGTWSAEAGVSLPFAVETDRDDAVGGGCGRSFPGATTRESSRGSPTAVAEARLVFSPPTVPDGGALRLIVGSGWYLGRGAPAVLAGIGYRWTRVSVDLEHGRVSVPFDVVERPFPGESVVRESGRRWNGVWQLRVAFELRRD